MTMKDFFFKKISILLISGKSSQFIMFKHIRIPKVLFQKYSTSAEARPTDPAYFDTYAQWGASYITGEFTLIQRTAGLVFNGPMAHLERGNASSGPSRWDAAAQGTFWRNFTRDSGSSNLEPLPTHWRTRFVREGATSGYGPFNGGSTKLLVWRDPGVMVEPFTCGETPAPFPLQATQVTSFKLTGKRIFLMAPIHHHYEKKGWAEPKIIVRFWIIAVLLALVSLSSMKLR